jgi:tRNA A37 threonylcarbamoyladenosine dehydratase
MIARKMMTANEASPVVLIAGVGTVGSPAAELLARQCPDITQILVDPDIVLPHNLAKSALYRPSDVGQYKVIAAARHLREIEPARSESPISWSQRSTTGWRSSPGIAPVRLLECPMRSSPSSKEAVR